MPLSVIGAGLSRTGTLSLKFALEQLGVGRCFHMIEMFQNPIVEPFAAAARGEAVDWEQAFEGYAASVDLPSARFYREQAEAFPDARVILTVRDPEAWFRSTQSTVFSPESPMRNRPADAPPPTEMEIMLQAVVDEFFEHRLNDRETMLGVYHRHNEAVQRTIAPERLLVYDVAQGWAPLCAFLGVPLPEGPMPRVNSTAEFNARRGEREAVV